MRRLLTPAAIVLASSLSACSIREGRIAMPAHLPAATERLELTGMGGGMSGSFRLADARGMFTRSAERLGIFDPLLVRHRGGGSFRVEPASRNAALDGRCTYREGQINVGPVSITPRRLAFHCEFARDGRAINAGLLIEDPQSAFGTMHGRSEREGILFYEGQRIAVRSIHHDEGGGLPTPTPLGYAFAVDGHQVGAVDLNGLNKTIYAPRSGPQREAVIAAALALSIFWDPAEVQPD